MLSGSSSWLEETAGLVRSSGLEQRACSSFGPGVIAASSRALAFVERHKAHRVRTAALVVEVAAA